MPKTRKPSASSMLITPEFDKFLTLVEEASRSTEESVKHFVEPAPGTLRRATSKRHHIVLGRRGSGKSSLLRKAAANLTTDRRPIAYVDLEQFKGHSYPDVLLSILISTFREFKHWMDTAAIHPATKKSFWNKFFGTTPKRGSMNDPAASCGVSKRWLRPENQRFSDLKIPFETKQASGNQTHSDSIGNKHQNCQKNLTKR